MESPDELQGLVAQQCCQADGLLDFGLAPAEDPFAYGRLGNPHLHSQVSLRPAVVSHLRRCINYNRCATTGVVNDGPRVSKRLADLWAERIIQRRKQFGLTQERLAELSGLTQQGISQIERGEVLPRDDSKLYLARALGTTPGELFSWPPMSDLIEGAA